MHTSSYVFLSYARIDGQEFSKELYDELERRNVQAWLDVHNIASGSDWDAEIDKGLQNASAVAVILTPGSVASIQVKSEWNYALARNIPILPLLIRDCEVPRILNVFNYIDFRNDFDGGVLQFIEKLETLEHDHLRYLEATLRSFEIARDEALNPGRFLPKIEDLRNTISNWVGRVESQHNRIAEGLDEQKADILNSSRTKRERWSKIIGKRPQDVTEYFKDRVHERLTISHLLADPETKLVSIIGRGGMGKSAVATKVLSDLEDNRWPHTEEEIPVDGIIYLSTRTDGISLEQIFLNVAKLLGGQRETRLLKIWNNSQIQIEAKIDELLGALNTGLYIFLLDNIEDLLDRQSQLVDKDLSLFLDKALTSTHSARLLVTSREPIAFSQSVLRYDKHVPLLNGLPKEDAIQLLQELDPNGLYGLRHSSIEELERLCDVVHGVPRALEVAVGILANDPFITLDELINEFYQQEDAVKALIEEGYKRLDSDARRVMEALSIYGRPVSTLAIDYLLEPFSSGINVPQIVRRLSQTRMINVDRATKTLILHPIDRDFAYSRVPREGELYNLKDLHRRAAQFYRRQRKPEAMWEHLDDLSAHIIEYGHLIEAEDYNEAAEVMNSLNSFMSFISGKGFYAGKARQLRTKLEGKITDEKLLLDHYKELAFNYMLVGPLEKALDNFQTAEKLADASRNNASQCEILIGLGDSFRRLGENESAIAYFRRSAKLALELDDYKNELYAMFLESLAHIYQGKIDKAMEYAVYIDNKAREQNDNYRQGWAHNVRALIYVAIKKYESAIEHAEKAIQSFEDVGIHDPVGYQLNVIGLCYLYQQEKDKAADNFQKAYLLAQEEEQPRIEGFATFNLAYLYRLDDQHESSVDASTRSEKSFIAVGSRKNAEAAHFLRLAEQAKIANDLHGELTNLMQCAKAIRKNPDLYDGDHILQEIIRIAEDKSLNDFVTQANVILNSEAN